MSAKWDRCPKCKQPFEDCPHSIAEVEQWLKDRELESKIRKIVRQEIARK